VPALLDAIQVTSRQERELEAEIIERLEATPTSTSSPACPGPATGPGGGAARLRR
jgi:hypothetical protein